MSTERGLRDDGRCGRDLLLPVLFLRHYVLLLLHGHVEER